MAKTKANAKVKTKSAATSKDYYEQNNLKNARTNGGYTEVVQNLTKCPFCDLKSKYFVAEESKLVLTVNLFPYIDGHMLIIPKRHVEAFDELTDLEWKQLKKLITIGKKIIKEHFGVTGVNFLYRQGNNSGISLGHLHFHLIPTPKIILNPTYTEIKETPLETAERLRKTCAKLKK